MLGLCEQIRRELRGAQNLGFVRDNAPFRWAVKSVNANRTEHLFFGEREVNRTRPGDFVHPFDAIRAISERRHRRRAAHFPDFGHARNSRRRQNDRMSRAVFSGRSGQNNFAHARHARRDCQHQNRGRIRRAAIGSINPGARHRRVARAQTRAFGSLEFKIRRFLALVIRLDIFRRAFQRALSGIGQLAPCDLDFVV